MTRISKMKNMKKIFLLLIGLFLLVSLTSCDDTISYEGGVTLSIPKEIEEIYMNKCQKTAIASAAKSRDI